MKILSAEIFNGFHDGHLGLPLDQHQLELLEMNKLMRWRILNDLLLLKELVLAESSVTVLNLQKLEGKF